MMVAKLAMQESSVAATFLLLALMTFTTALTDIFVYAPAFAMFASFETCNASGGWFTGKPYKYECFKDYSKGVGRLLVSAQSLFTGLFYLATSISAWGAFAAVRDRQQLEVLRARQERYFYSERQADMMS